MPLRQGGIDKWIYGIPGIGLVRAGVDLDGEFHWILSQEELQQAGRDMLLRPKRFELDRCGHFV
jgi:hypothetical protein